MLTRPGSDALDTALVSDQVHPTQDDALVRRGSVVLGGPWGARGVAGESWWSPLRVLVVIATVTYALGYWLRWPCRTADFLNDDRYVRMCYTDIPYLYYGRGLAQGARPYLDAIPGVDTIEYPVLTGWFMWLAALLTGSDTSSATQYMRSGIFYDRNAVLLFLCFLVAVVATALTVKRRPWDGAMVAAAPAVVMTGLINWDLLAVAITAVSFLLWARGRVGWAGITMGLAISAKFYPLVLLGAVVLVAARERRWRDATGYVAAAVGAWGVVNLPVALAAPEQWARFYTFSQERGVDFGSVYLAAQYLFDVSVGDVNRYGIVGFGLLGLAITWLVFRAPVAPRVEQIALLVLIAFTVTNKVYSPQYVLWLLPFAVLARPRWREFLIWQAGQVQYTIAVWLFLEQYGQEGRRGLPEETYALSILVMVALTLWYAALVVRDVWVGERPEGVPAAVKPESGSLESPPVGAMSTPMDVMARTGNVRPTTSGNSREPDSQPHIP